MSRSVRTAFIFILVAVFSIATAVGACAQQQSRKEKKSSPRQEYAVYLLDSVIDQAREVESLEDRTSLAEAVVPLLASIRPERCRQMLDGLFDAALRQKDQSSLDNKQPAFDLARTIRRIIQTAALFDRKLADSYIEKYTRDKETDSSDSTRKPHLTPEAAEMYMKIAVDLVDKEPSLAISVALRALSVSVPKDTLVLLAKLRKRDSRLANTFLLSALGSIQNSGGADINELLLLYSYVFSPLQVLQAVPQGLAILSLASYQPLAVNYPVEPELARSYLTIATQIVLSPTRYETENLGRLVEGPNGDLIFINIVEPQVASYLPELAYSLSERRIFLAGFLQTGQRQQTEASVDRWRKALGENATSRNRPDSSDYNLRSAEEAVDPRRKNQLFYRAASAAVREAKYELALQIVDKMSDEYHEQARQFIKYEIALQSIHDGKLDLADEWVQRNADLPQKAFLYTSLAEVMLKSSEKNLSQVSEALNQVEQIADKLENKEKAAALIGLAVVTSEFDSGRALNQLRAGVNSANKVDSFTGDTAIPRMLNIAGFYYDYSLYRGEFTFVDAVRQLARANFDGTVVEVHEVKNRLARLRATITLCSTILGDKRSP